MSKIENVQYSCDRCYEHESGPVWPKGWWTVSKQDSMYSSSDVYWDLCSSCTEEFKKFVRTEGEKR